MKANNNIILKVTKNRFTGITDQWLMDIDYPKMRFMDHEGLNDSTYDSGEQKERHEKYVKNEIKKIEKNELDEILNNLGV